MTPRVGGFPVEQTQATSAPETGTTGQSARIVGTMGGQEYRTNSDRTESLYLAIALSLMVIWGLFIGGALNYILSAQQQD